MALSGSDLEDDPWIRILLLGPAKTGKTCCVIATSPGPVHVLLCESDSALKPAARMLGGKAFTFERIRGWNCLDDETEALTQRGWIKGFDLRDGDVLLTKNADTGALEWQSATIKKFYDYALPMVEFKSKTFHAVSTHNHRWLVHNRTRDVCKTADEISVCGSDKIHRTGKYVGPEVQKYSDEFVELVGWFLTDGTAPKNERVGIYQSERAKPYNVARIDDLFSRMSGLVVHRHVSTRDRLACWRLPKQHPLAWKLRDMFPGRELTYEFLCELPVRQLRLLQETMMRGDGTVQPTYSRFCAGTKSAAEKFQMLCTMCGIATTLKHRDMSKYKPKSDKLRGIPKMTQIWMVHLLRNTYTQIAKHFRSEVPTNGRVWCPIVPNTFFVARRSGTVFITGNTMSQAVQEAKKAVEAGRLKTLVIDPLSDFAQKLEEECLASTDTGRGPDGRRAYPEFNRRLRHLLDQLFRLECHLVVITHYIDVGGGEVAPDDGGDPTPRVGEGIVPLLAGKARALVAAKFPDVVWFDYKKGERVLVTGPTGAWGPGCRSLNETQIIPADFTKNRSAGIKALIEAFSVASKPVKQAPTTNVRPLRPAATVSDHRRPPPRR